jgi:dTDP-4-dehydrorhamnose 3,5-epimerase
MKVVETDIPGPLILEPQVFGDDRGFFLESWNAERFRAAGLDFAFVQDNHSRSAKGVLRGLHFQNPNAQGKLLRVTAGRIWDVAVDLRKSSSHFAKWIGVELSASNKRMLWIPPGFAHGFVTLEDGTDFLYKCTAFYEPSAEQTLQWDDPSVGIRWPTTDVVLSAKDAAGKRLSEITPFA